MLINIDLSFIDIIQGYGSYQQRLDGSMYKLQYLVIMIFCDFIMHFEHHLFEGINFQYYDKHYPQMANYFVYFL